MPPASNVSNDNLIPARPLPAGAEAFSKQMSGLLDGKPKDDATVEQAFAGMDDMFDVIAAGLYNMASMLVGEGEAGVRLVETAVANADISACHDPVEARKSSRRALCIAALKTIAQQDPEDLAAPRGLSHAATCIEDDDLDAAGVSGEEFQRMMAGPDRDRVRKWLTGLPTSLRTIFVLRAVAGFSADETAGLLAAHGGPHSAGWDASEVRELFRQALCSLASQLIQASVASL
jgi:hypothetical protein